MIFTEERVKRMRKMNSGLYYFFDEVHPTVQMMSKVAWEIAVIGISITATFCSYFVGRIVYNIMTGGML